MRTLGNQFEAHGGRRRSRFADNAIPQSLLRGRARQLGELRERAGKQCLHARALHLVGRHELCHALGGALKMRRVVRGEGAIAVPHFPAQRGDRVHVRAPVVAPVAAVALPGARGHGVGGRVHVFGIRVKLEVRMVGGGRAKVGTRARQFAHDVSAAQKDEHGKGGDGELDGLVRRLGAAQQTECIPQRHARLDESCVHGRQVRQRRVARSVLVGRGAERDQLIDEVTHRPDGVGRAKLGVRHLVRPLVPHVSDALERCVRGGQQLAQRRVGRRSVGRRQQLGEEAAQQRHVGRLLGVVAIDLLLLLRPRAHAFQQLRRRVDAGRGRGAQLKHDLGEQRLRLDPHGAQREHGVLGQRERGQRDELARERLLRQVRGGHWLQSLRRFCRPGHLVLVLSCPVVLLSSTGNASRLQLISCEGMARPDATDMQTTVLLVGESQKSFLRIPESRPDRERCFSHSLTRTEFPRLFESMSAQESVCSASAHEPARRTTLLFMPDLFLITIPDARFDDSRPTRPPS